MPGPPKSLWDLIEEAGPSPDLAPQLGDAARGAAEGAVTGLLGGPVDLATMALRPMGYDVERPVGGSEWIRDRLQSGGFYPERTGTAGEAIGELAGSLAAPGPDAGPLMALAGLTGVGGVAVGGAALAGSDDPGS